MNVPDKKSVMKVLIDSGKSKGQLNTKEILDALGEFDFEPEQIEKIYDNLESEGIEIIEDFDYLQVEDLDVVDKEDDEDIENVLSTEGIAIDDPVKVYLKEIGRVPLLSPEDEIDLAIRIKDGDEAAKKTTVRSQPASGCQHCKALLGQRNAVLGFDSRRKLGLD